MNTALRDAMAGADLTVGKLARKVGVTVKTAERWLSDPTRVPHPRTRAEIETALGVSADVLWPKVVRSTVKTGPDREIVSACPYRNACPTSVWARLIDGASRRICFAGYTNYFLWQDHPRLADRLTRKGENGCSIRFILGDPDSEVTRRREEVEGVPLTVGTRIRITLDALSKLMGRLGSSQSSVTSTSRCRSSPLMTRCWSHLTSRTCWGTSRPCCTCGVSVTMACTTGSPHT